MLCYRERFDVTHQQITSSFGTVSYVFKLSVTTLSNW